MPIKGRSDLKLKRFLSAFVLAGIFVTGSATVASAAVPVKDAVKLVQQRKADVTGEKEREKERNVSPEKERSVTERKI